MKIHSVVCMLLLLAGCGYKSSQQTTAPQPGVTPAIAELVPDNVNAGSSAFTLTVNGSNFASNAAVNWGSTHPTTTRVSGNQLTAAIPADALGTAGTVSVTVTNPGTAGGPYGGGTQSETSNAMTFTVN